MWDYPKSSKHQSFIDQIQATHDRELAKVRAAEKKQMRAVDAQQALSEVKAKLTATRAQTARLREERLARVAANPVGPARSARKK